MKKILILALFSLSSLIAHAEALETCQYEVEIDADTPKSNVDIVVESGQGGGIAIGLVKIDGELKIISDVINQKTYSADQKNELFSETMLGAIATNLKIDLKNLDHALVTNIDPEKNADDASGASVIRIYNAANEVILKVAQAGWSYGRCL